MSTFGCVPELLDSENRVASGWLSNLPVPTELARFNRLMTDNYARVIANVVASLLADDRPDAERRLAPIAHARVRVPRRRSVRRAHMVRVYQCDCRMCRYCGQRTDSSVLLVDREIGLRMHKARHMIVTGGPFPLLRDRGAGARR